MMETKPEKIVLEYSDGSTSESSFDDLPATLQSQLLRQPFAARPCVDPKKERFVILEWDDGWKEVFLVDPSCTDINRYYVISRPEDVGRLSLNKADGFPELIELDRKPLDIKKITFVDTFRLSLEQSAREGKKIDHFFEMEKANDAFSEMAAVFEQASREEGLDKETLSGMDREKANQAYGKIAQRMGLRAGQRQQDLLDFITFLIRA